MLGILWPSGERERAIIKDAHSHSWPSANSKFVDPARRLLLVLLLCCLCTENNPLSESLAMQSCTSQITYPESIFLLYFPTSGAVVLNSEICELTFYYSLFIRIPDHLFLSLAIFLAVQAPLAVQPGLVAIACSLGLCGISAFVL